MKAPAAIVILFLLAINSCAFAPGSYPYAEVYTFEHTEKQLIRAIDSFKINNSGYTIENHDWFVDGRSDENDHWYHVWFYYTDSREVVKCWIREKDYEGGTDFAFVGIGQWLSFENYKLINRDFSKLENQAQKQKFEKEILEKIKSYL